MYNIKTNFNLMPSAKETLDVDQQALIIVLVWGGRVPNRPLPVNPSDLFLNYSSSLQDRVALWCNKDKERMDQTIGCSYIQTDSAIWWCLA